MTEMSTTRSAGDDPQNDKIAENVKVGVFAAKANSNTDFLTNGTNNSLTSDGNNGLTFDDSKEIYFPTDASEKIDIYGYAPYNSEWTTLGVQNFTVSKDQSTKEGYLASDLLWATPLEDQGNSEDSYTLPFTHKLCKIIIKIDNQRISGDKAISLKGAKVYVRNTKTSTTINLADGTMGTASNVATITAAEFAEADITTAETTNYESASASIIIPEQTLSAGQIVKIVTAATEIQPSTSLYASLAAEKTLNASTSYDINVTIEPTAVSLTLGTSLTGWTSDGSATGQDGLTYGVGDYILNDGTFLKNSELSSASNDTKNKIIAVIFSTDVSANDQATYDGYAVSTGGPLSGLTWGTATLLRTAITTSANAVNDLDGLLAQTNAKLQSDYSTSFTAFACASAPSINEDVITAGKLSGWFMPSFGQMVQLLEGLGGNDAANLGTTISADATSNNNVSFDVSIVNIITNVNNYKVNSDIITGNGDGTSNDKTRAYATSTEQSNDNMWMIKFPGTSTTGTMLWLAKQCGKTNNTRYVVPIIACQLR